MSGGPWALESTGMRVVAVIPARAGSQRIPSKNLRLVGGRALVARTVDVARAVDEIDRVIVSTDSNRIAAVARRAGGEAPFRRPAALADDRAATVDVVRHAVEWLEQTSGTVDLVVTLQPTSPFCRVESVRAALQAMADPTVDSSTTVSDTGVPASVLGTLRDGRFDLLAPRPDDVRRQASPPVVRLTGAVYVSRRALLDAGRLLGDRPAAILTSGPEAIDIDTPEDLAAARRIHRRLPRTVA